MLKIDIDVKFDPDQLGDRLGEMISKAMDDIANSAFLEWQNVARRELWSTRDQYVDSINRRKIDDYTHYIFLRNDRDDDKLPNMLEGGYPPFNVFKAMLDSPRASTKRKLYYFSDCPNVRRRGKSKQDAWYPKPGGGFGQMWPPFMDFPNRIRGKYRRSMNRCAVPGGDPPFYRAYRGNMHRFIHPGFKPLGKMGLDTPLRQFAIDHVVEVAQDLFTKVFKEELK